MTLQWQGKRIDERGYKSVCNRYSVCSIVYNDVETWEAWKMVPGGAWFAPLAIGLRSEDEARKAAEADARGVK